jgi:hypothetical protein
MAYDPRKISLLEVAGIVSIIVSAVLLAGLVYSIDAGRLEVAETAYRQRFIPEPRLELIVGCTTYDKFNRHRNHPRHPSVTERIIALA